MHFQLLTDLADFRHRTRSLLADEARNNLMLGILSTIDQRPEAFEAWRAMVVTDGEDVVAGALITTPPENLIVAAFGPGRAVAALAEGVLGAGVSVPRVIGVTPIVDKFVDEWQMRTGGAARLNMAQGVYALGEVLPVPPVAGRMRPATEGDLDLILAWSIAFAEEALPDDPRDDDRLELVLTGRLRGQTGTGIWLWEVDGVAVAMSAHSGQTGSGIRINAVYTPPPNRRNGYATALVAAQSQALLDSGYRSCFLFTDLGNPTSNRIYESIGYRRVADAALYELIVARRSEIGAINRAT